VTAGEGQFLDACLAEDPAEFVRTMSDEPLRCLGNYLEGRKPKNGVAAVILSQAKLEAGTRWFKLQQGGGQ
jgi:hypothetical protein